MRTYCGVAEQRRIASRVLIPTIECAQSRGRSGAVNFYDFPIRVMPRSLRGGVRHDQKVVIAVSRRRDEELGMSLTI